MANRPDFSSHMLSSVDIAPSPVFYRHTSIESDIAHRPQLTRQPQNPKRYRPCAILVKMLGCGCRGLDLDQDLRCQIRLGQRRRGLSLGQGPRPGRGDVLCVSGLQGAVFVLARVNLLIIRKV